MVTMALVFSVSNINSQCNEIYITPTGTGAGTQADPTDLLTGLSMAASGDRLLLSIGTYTITNPITNIPDGIVMEGGFDDGAGWEKTSLAGATTINRTNANPEGAAGQQRLVAIYANSATGFRLQDLTITTDNAGGNGISTYGVHLTNCSNYVFTRVAIAPGNGSNGSSGAGSSDVGSTGSNGSIGGAGSCDGNYTCCFGSESAPGGNGGAGGSGATGVPGGANNSSTTQNNPGTNGTGRNGGGGGAGGKGGGFSGGNASETGNNGGGSATVAVNTGRGTAGGQGDPGNDGGNGASGSNGSIGSTGATGNDSYVSGYYVPGTGAQGGFGSGGSGGAGGGGGGRQDCATCNNGPGNGGAGGGGGGSGGGGGFGGNGGGGSIGIYLYNNGANGAFYDCDVAPGNGGTGGVGGAGANGGSGGAGGPRRTTCSSEIGEGGSGGAGGAGGTGGTGGTGSAGLSLQVYLDAGTALTVNDVSDNLSALPVITWDNEICSYNTGNFGASASGNWDFGASATPSTTTGAAVSTEYTATGRYSVDYNGNVYTDFVFITPLSPDMADAGPDQDLCATGTTTNLAAVAPSVGTGSWTSLGSAVVTTPASNTSGVTGLVTGLNQFVWTVDNGSCCPVTKDTVDINMVDPPSSSSAGIDSTVCGVTSLQLYANTPAIGTGTWSVVSGSGVFTDPNDPVTTVTGLSAGANEMAWTISNGTCPTEVDNMIVTVSNGHTLPTSITLSNNNFCVGGSVDLIQVGGTAAAGGDWVWYEGGCGSGTPIGTGNSVTGLMPTATTDYYVRAEGGSCVLSPCFSVTVTVDQVPTAANAGADQSVCDPTGILNGNTPSIGTGTWSTVSGSGSADSPTASNSGISGLTPGNTTVMQWTITNGACPSSSDQVAIDLGVSASALDSATTSGDNICPEDTVTLTAWSATPLPSGYTYVWYTGACGAVPVGVGQTLDVSPSGTDTYYVRAVGTCGASLCSSVTVTVLPGSVTPNGIISDNNNFCMGGSANLSVDGGSLEAGAVWTWYENSCGGGTAIGTGATISVTPTSPTTYYVRGEGGACGNTLCATVNINVHGAQVYLVPFDTVCVEGNTAFSLTGGLPVGGSYSGTAVAGGVFDASAAGVGAHAITYTYTDGFGCSNTAVENIEVVEANIAATSITADNNVVCSSGTANLTINGGTLVTGADWIWYENACGGGASIGTGTTLSVSPSQTTTYFARAEGGNAYCGPSECVAITISVSYPEANLLPFDDVCGSNLVTLSQGIPSGGAYSGTGVSGSSFDAGAAGVGTHTITYTYTDGNGCSAVATGDITVMAGSINLETVIETQTCANGGVTVHAVATGGSGAYIYVWSDGSTDNPHRWTDPGMYTVTATDGLGCAATADSIEVSEDLACLELANTFTPNADGTNDTWNLDFTAYTSATLEVYSKWGVLVYQTDGLTIQWNGDDLNGNALPAGTYYYIVELDQGNLTQNGPISIVR